PRPEGEARPLRTASRGRRSAMPIQQTDENYSATSIGSTITNLPIEPLFRNLIRPVILAKSVSSLPRPTLSPGFTRVPRCRTMIVPPGTICPPKALNPSRCAFESRPFREVPCPFLCAMNKLSQLSVDFQLRFTSFSWARISSPPSSERPSWLRAPSPALWRSSPQRETRALPQAQPSLLSVPSSPPTLEP